MNHPFNAKDLNELLQIFLKRWQIAAGIFFLSFIIVIFLTLRQRYSYESTAKIMISENVGSRALPSNIDSFRSYFYEQQEFATFPYLIRSKPVATAIANRMLGPDSKDPQRLEPLIAEIRNCVSINRVEESRLFEMHATNLDALKSQQIANAAADVFIERNLERKLNTFQKSVSWLTDQLVDLEYKLEQSQKDLIGFIETERVSTFGEETILPKSAVADQEISESRGMMQRLNATKVELELELQRLTRRYTDKHPQIIRAREELGVTLAKIANEEKTFKNRDEVREDEAIRLKQKEIKYSILKRKVEINKELYNSLQQKMKEIDIASAINDNNMDIMEYAPLPGTPQKPNKPRQIILGFLVCMILSGCIPFLMDYLDPTIRTQSEVEGFLGLPVLSSIPVFSPASANSKTPHFPVVNVASTEAESFRILRTNIRFSFPSGSGRCLLVTSSEPHEGKSTLASNLAITMAGSGSKTCLVDSDLRIPKIHKMFNLNNERGLSNFLVGDEKQLEKLIVPSGFENLDILTSGVSSPKPAELLETTLMQKTVQDLLKIYDRVIFDSPPAGNIIDASILSSYVDGIIFVLQVGRINKKHVRNAKIQLERVKANICGVVLNKMEVNKSNYYYYYYHQSRQKEEQLILTESPDKKQKVS